MKKKAKNPHYFNKTFNNISRDTYWKISHIRSIYDTTYNKTLDMVVNYFWEHNQDNLEHNPKKPYEGIKFRRNMRKTAERIYRKLYLQQGGKEDSS